MPGVEYRRSAQRCTIVLMDSRLQCPYCARLPCRVAGLREAMSQGARKFVSHTCRSRCILSRPGPSRPRFAGEQGHFWEYRTPFPCTVTLVSQPYDKLAGSQARRERLQLSSDERHAALLQR